LSSGAAERAQASGVRLGGSARRASRDASVGRRHRVKFISHRRYARSTDRAAGRAAGNAGGDAARGASRARD
jgi:hypothetical protein